MSQSSSFPRTLLLAAVVAVGVAAFWYTAVTWTSNTARQAFRTPKPYENIHVTVAGEPVIVRTSDGSTQNTEQILSLDRQPVAVASQDVLYPTPLNAETHPNYAYMPQWYTRIVGINDGGVPATYWYMVHNGQINGLAYGIGFHASTRRVTGYFGRSGFSDSIPPRSEWFRVPGSTAMYGKVNVHGYGQEPRWSMGKLGFLLLAEGKLWKIDLVKKQITALLDCPSAVLTGQVYRLVDSPPLAKEQTGYYSAQSMTPMDGIVRELNALLVVNLQTGEQFRYPLPPELRSMQLSAVRLANEQLLLIANEDWRSEEYHVVWLMPSGEIARQLAVRIESQYEPRSWAARGWQMAAAGPLPLYNAVYSLLVAPQQAIDEDQEAAEYSQALMLTLSRTWPSILAVLAVGVVCSVLAFRRQRKYGLPQAGPWAVFAFLFGVPGWIAYRYHRTWPVLEACAACHQPSPRDREKCLDCGASFPPPPLKGVEVFA